MAPKASQKVPQEVILEGKGGIPKVVPPFPLQRQRKARLESGFGSAHEIRPHAKNEDSYAVWTHFGLLEYRFFDFFGVCI